MLLAFRNNYCALCQGPCGPKESFATEANRDGSFRHIRRVRYRAPAGRQFGNGDVVSTFVAATR